MRKALALFVVNSVKAFLIGGETRASSRSKMLFGLSVQRRNSMGKYNDWTLGEIEALLNIVGGEEVARAVLRGERKLTVKEVSSQPLISDSMPVANNSLLTTYDPSVGLYELIKLAVGERNFGEINPDITLERLKIRKGIQKVNLEVMPLVGGESLEQAVERLKAVGHDRFPNAGDLAGFLHEYPDEVRKWSDGVAVVSEDSRWKISNYVYVPYARVLPLRRCFAFCFFHILRGPHCGILVFSKQQP